MQAPFFVLLDDARQQTATLYEDLVHIDAFQADQLLSLDKHGSLQSVLEQHWQKAWHAVVWAPYGFGRELMGLDPLLKKGGTLTLEPEQTLTETKPDSAELDYVKDQLLIYWFQRKTQLKDETSIQAWLIEQAQAQQETFPEERQSLEYKTPSGLAQIRLTQDRDSYIQSIEQVREDIAAGQVYQINYTTQFNFKAYGSPYSLYQKIREHQRVPYGALAYLPGSTDCAPNTWTLCFSPELFLDIRQDGSIHTEPMKGTVPTADDGRNDERAEALRADPKNRAENVMIVDLLRNDLSKIAIPNGVQVPELFKVTNFGSVLQMTTHIQAQAKPTTQADDIFNALFPCGSITGAPKKMSMQLIDKYESRPRGLYTGSIGFLEPCQGGLGFYGKLNVIIRTLELKADNYTDDRVKPKQHNSSESTPIAQNESVTPEIEEALIPSTIYPLPQFTGKMGVGSGIVYDSTAAEEYEECYWKARFLRNLTPDFSLFETMRVDISHAIRTGDVHVQCTLLESHIARLQRSAVDLGFKFDELKIRQQLETYLNYLASTVSASIQDNAQQRQTESSSTAPSTSNETSSYTPNSQIEQHTYRLKATLHGDGSLELQSASLDALVSLDSKAEQTVILAESALANQDILRRYKTTHRQVYDKEMQRAISQGAFDSLCFNQDGYLLEGARSSIFALVQGQWLTPNLDLDILQSVMRAEVLQKPEHWLRPHTPPFTDQASGATSPITVQEACITLEQLQSAEQILAVNALREIVPVKLI